MKFETASDWQYRTEAITAIRIGESVNAVELAQLRRLRVLNRFQGVWQSHSKMTSTFIGSNADRFQPTKHCSRHPLSPSRLAGEMSLLRMWISQVFACCQPLNLINGTLKIEEKTCSIGLDQLYKPSKADRPPKNFLGFSDRLGS